jgi:hypothetical protein
MIAQRCGGGSCCSGGGSGGGGGRSSVSGGGHLDGGDRLHDLDACAGLLDLDLAEISFAQDGGEFADEASVELAILFGRLTGMGFILRRIPMWRKAISKPFA